MKVISSQDSGISESLLPENELSPTLLTFPQDFGRLVNPEPLNNLPAISSKSPQESGILERGRL